MSFGLFIKSAGGVEHEVVLNMEAPQQVRFARCISLLLRRMMP